MNRITFLLLSFLTISVYAAAQQNLRVTLSSEDSVRTMIEALPEVREKDNIYDSLTNRMQHIVIKIIPPDTAVPFYQVQAGYEGGTRFNPHFYFFVDLRNEVIFIEDLDHGDRTTLDQWRARRAPQSDQK